MWGVGGEWETVKIMKQSLENKVVQNKQFAQIIKISLRYVYVKMVSQNWNSQAWRKDLKKNWSKTTDYKILQCEKVKKRFQNN